MNPCIPTYIHAQLDDVGEMLVEVGAPCGWGPVGLTPEQLASVLGLLREGAAAKGAVATVVSFCKGSKDASSNW
jgi:hypothetical protein